MCTENKDSMRKEIDLILHSQGSFHVGDFEDLRQRQCYDGLRKEILDIDNVMMD